GGAVSGAAGAALWAAAAPLAPARAGRAAAARQPAICLHCAALWHQRARRYGAARAAVVGAGGGLLRRRLPLARCRDDVRLDGAAAVFCPLRPCPGPPPRAHAALLVWAAGSGRAAAVCGGLRAVSGRGAVLAVQPQHPHRAGAHGAVQPALISESAGTRLFCHLQHAAHQHPPPAHGELAGGCQHRPQSQPKPSFAAALRRPGVAPCRRRAPRARRPAASPRAAAVCVG
nr:hypothetical protein [Tanacetum cinerariifolium]